MLLKSKEGVGVGTEVDFFFLTEEAVHEVWGRDWGTRVCSRSLTGCVYIGVGL